jgi:heme transport system substrate-binding protein
VEQIMKKPSLAVVIALVVGIITACGGESADSTSTTSAPATTSTSAAVTSTTAAATTTLAEIGWSFTGPDGVETTITDVSRIISLNGDITEIIYELGLGGQVVGVDVTTTYPDEAAALIETGQTVGFAQQLTSEAVLRLEPTLVIGDTSVAPAEAVEQLRDAGVPVAIIQAQATLDGVTVKIGDVAEILGVQDEGAIVADRVADDIETATSRVVDETSDPAVAYVYARGPQVLLLFGGGMPTQAMIEGAGAVDAVAATGVFGPVPLTPEALIAAQPEVIVLPESGIQALGGIDAFEALPGVSDTPAGENGSYLIYDEAFFFNLGPRVGQALDQFIDDLYPGLD